MSDKSAMCDSTTKPGMLLRVVQQAARDHVLPGFRRLSATQVHVKSRPEDLVTDADRGDECAAK